MSTSPRELLKKYVHEYVDDNDLPAELKNEVPHKWEKYGDFILFDARCFSSDLWFQQGQVFWEKMCEVLKCKRLALKSRIRSDGFRTPNVKILVGDNPWTLCLDNGLKYSWNVEKNMFCAGNASERYRIGKLDCRGQVVVDLFAGIGYFVLPFLVHAKAEVVHACEWNPDAVVALRRNLKLNDVEDKCVIYEGDNRLVCPKGLADRVNLGLIPTSEASWRVACEALKPSGGVLHIHGNVETLNTDITCEICKVLLTDMDVYGHISLKSAQERLLRDNSDFGWKRRQWLFWGVHVLHSLKTIMRDLDSEKKWIFSVENVHNIKSYAPHVDHVVLDVSLAIDEFS